MRALALTDNGLTYANDWPHPAPSGQQALIRIRQAGICNTDLELVKGYLHFRGVLGHEFVGEVVGGDSGWLGARVVGEINVACGQCDLCRAGIPSQCRNRTTVGIRQHDGAFADHCTASPTRSATPKPCSSSRWPPPTNSSKAPTSPRGMRSSPPTNSSKAPTSPRGMRSS